MPTILPFLLYKVNEIEAAFLGHSWGGHSWADQAETNEYGHPRAAFSRLLPAPRRRI